MHSRSFSQTGLSLTKQFEGIELEAYLDSGGVWTVGYGHTGQGVHAGLVITLAEAEIFLASDLDRAVGAVNRLVASSINQNQFDALVDFTFNLGLASLAHSSLLRYVNENAFVEATAQFYLWDHCCGVVVPGLLARREKEAALFAS